MQAEDVRISRQATQITLNEYQAGTQAFTAVVVAEAQQLTRRRSRCSSTQAQVQTDVVNLIVALGGGWSQSKLPDVDGANVEGSRRIERAARWRRN